MKSLLVMLSLIILSGCWAKTGQTFTMEKPLEDTGSAYPFLKRSAGLSGEMPLHLVLQQLQKLELLRTWPPSPLPAEPAIFLGYERVSDTIAIVERATGWVYDPDLLRFYIPPASHSIEQPDTFGDATSLIRADLSARSHVSVGLRFRRVSAGFNASLDDQNINVAGQVTRFSASIPEGVPATWNSTQERSYFEGIESAEGNGEVVKTERKTVDSGLIVNMIASRLPGGLFRIDGTMEISSFIGSDLSRAKVSVPLQLDGPRHMWLRTLIIHGGDAGFEAAFRHFGMDATATGEALELCVRVD